MSLDSFAWQITQLSCQATTPLLVIAQHNRELQQLRQAIQFFDPSIACFSFVDWETLPYERLSPAKTQSIQRLQTLSQLMHCPQGVILSTPYALLQRLAPKNYISAYVFQFTLGDKLDMTQLQRRLADAGYQRVATVHEAGEFTIRGSLIDIFPLDTQSPFRIHTDIDTIENLYFFDPETQQPNKPIDSIRILPIREFLLSEKSIALCQEKASQLLGTHFKKSSLSQQLSPNSYISGTEYYLPLFFETTHTLLDYLPSNTRWITTLDLFAETDKTWQQINRRYQQLKSDIQWPILPPEVIYQPCENFISQLHTFIKVTFEHFPVAELSDLRHTHYDHFPEKLQAFLKKLSVEALNPKFKILFYVNRLSQQENFLKHLKKINLQPKIVSSWQEYLITPDAYQVIVAPLTTGFWIKNLSLFLIPDRALYSKTYVPLEKEKTNALHSPPVDEIFRNLSQLIINDVVVHVDHGIGRYLGLQYIQTEEHLSEFIVLAYAENTKLYVPIQDIQYITRYTGQENPPLHYLNSNHWKKTKQKTLTHLKDTAAELLDLYAKRAKAQGDKFDAPNKDYEAFSEAFAFEETKDQISAIQSTLNDLMHDKPMDRLICGDVGFGKTEVAMRAAFLAVQSKKQVAILAPTTLLVEQHYRNFCERFSNWPVKIESLSRFRSPKESYCTKQRLKEGKIDIIIGTHALLSKSVAFQSLGLLIIDEEHHFGVQQKETLKLFKAHVNVLTLTATPIPRTLQTALSNLRTLSLITTPPPKRLSVKNFITLREPHRIREAILRELLRGGQVYFVHNRVQNLARIAREIQTLVPEAKIEVAHGQLEEKDLEARMESFYQQQYNVLICTSIIETGLDIPTTNTLIVDRADHFGLAQLHQLRGRIGRSHHQAYAYFLISPQEQLTSSARKRLEALKNLTELGSGFSLASYDLDIRGAGTLLGKEQSGVIEGIGFSLYMELLQKTIEAVKAGDSLENLDNNPHGLMIDLKIPAFIPDHYLSDISARLEYYRKINKAENTQTLTQIQQELIDRCGKFPCEVQYLFSVNQLKTIAKCLGIKKIESTTRGGWISFLETTSINPTHLIRLVQQASQKFQLSPSPQEKNPRLRFFWQTDITPQQKIDYIRWLFDKLC